LYKIVNVHIRKDFVEVSKNLDTSIEFRPESNFLDHRIIM